MVTFCLSNSFIVYQNNSYKTLKGIPTGSSISRQEADIFLHWLIFIVLSGKIPMWNLMKFWRRYIDDILGIWRGTERQFNQFISNLNSLTLPYGIKFDKTKIGKSINFLDTTLYLEKDDSGKWKIQHSIYRKPTDAVRFLRRDSFHPPHIFKSVPYSQYLRVISRHSEISTRDESMRELTRGFMEAGHKENELDTQRNKALNSSIASEDPNTTNIQPDTLVFAFKFFKEHNQIRKLFKEIQPDINSIIGDTRIIFVLRKGPSIGNLLTHNRQVCTSVDKVNAPKDQRCLMARCMTCGLMNRNETASTNGTSVKLAQNVNCKTENVIYFAQCKKCNKENSYVGKTTQELHQRVKGHRSKFTKDAFQKSALSMHSFEEHSLEHSIDSFEFSILKRTPALNLHREEFRYIEKLRTKTFGLNRMKVIR